MKIPDYIPGDFVLDPETSDRYVVAQMRDYKELDIRDGDRVLDLGANIGAFTAYAKHRAPSCTVTAVEASPLTIDLLRRNCALFPGTTVAHGVACHIGTGTQKFYCKRDTAVFSSVYPIRGYDEVEVPCIDAAALIAQHDVVKIDIEGSEYGIIEAACFDGARSLAVEFHFKHRENDARLVPCIRKIEAAGLTCTVDTSWWESCDFEERRASMYTSYKTLVFNRR